MASSISDPEYDGLPSAESTSFGPNQAAFRARLEQFTHTSPTRALPAAADYDVASNMTRANVASKSSTPISSVTASSRKRASNGGESTPKKKRSTAKERSENDPHNPENNLVDSLRPGLILVFIGLNPGLKTAETGHAYAHPSNRFWHLLHESGVTPRKHLPSETHDLPDLYSIGNTNICARPTRDGSGLRKEELAEGAGILEEKIREFKPQAVCIVGKQIWEALWLARTGKKLKKDLFKWGWQDEDNWLGRIVDDDEHVLWPGARTFVSTSTSGLSASMKPHEKLEVWLPLGEWFKERTERGEQTGVEQPFKSGEHSS